MEFSEISAWIHEQALPLWTTVGFDETSGTVWEALSHGGRPLSGRAKRMQVQMRQAYCFARACRLKGQSEHRVQDLTHKAEQLVKFALDSGVDPGTGYLASELAPDGTILAAPHNLLDVAHLLLAISELIRTGKDMTAELSQAEAMLSQLKATDLGWRPSLHADDDAPMSHVPHMHLFEAATALYSVTARDRFDQIATTCLTLFRDHVLQPDGAVPVMVSSEWEPLEFGQRVEPGLMAEWVFLIDAWERAAGKSSDIDLMPMFVHACAARDQAGALPDMSRPKSDTRRLWPQTELLKASIVLAKRGCVLPEGADPVSVAQMIWREYLDVPVKGGWYDQRAIDGVLVSRDMPASSFYHLLVALTLYADL